MSDKELNTRTFCSLGIKKWLAENASKLGLCEATAVQRACIPPILKGVDVIGTSQTGSGKTAAFALPILQILSQDSYGIFALCMTPTRELAVQISEQFYALSSGLTLRCHVITGGEDIAVENEIELLKKSYKLEYGYNSLSIQKESLRKYQSYAIVDDLLATGGTVNCVSSLIEEAGKKNFGLVVVAELKKLDARSKLKLLKVGNEKLYFLMRNWYFFDGRSWRGLGVVWWRRGPAWSAPMQRGARFLQKVCFPCSVA